MPLQLLFVCSVFPDAVVLNHHLIASKFGTFSAKFPCLRLTLIKYCVMWSLKYLSSQFH